MQFNFRLAPVEEIVPWGASTGQPTLHWFGLTDGWFWIEIGGQELFRYTQEILDYFVREYPDAQLSLLPYTDYQVVRYWEDLLDMLLSILEPVPNDLALRVDDSQGWLQWEAATSRWREDNIEDADDPRNIHDAEVDWWYEGAVLWWSERHWDAGHLKRPPNIWLWRVEDTIHVRWNNRDVKIEGIPVWEAQQGEITLPVSEFMAAVESFHERFLSEMGKRVDEAVTAWARPDVKIDLVYLVHEQEERQDWLERAVSPWAEERRHKTSWDEVRAAMATIANELTPIASTKGVH